jgi:hypothetical protein
MDFFGRKQKQPETHASADKRLDSEVHLEEDFSELVAREEPRSVDRAISDAHEAAHEATREEITRIKLIEQGYCPECRSRIENFVFTQVCPSCGWFRRLTPDSGRCLVHMDTDECIKCDKVFPVHGEQFLCVTDGVVYSQIMREHVRRIEYSWEAEELAEARETLQKRMHGVCSWCEKDLTDVPNDQIIEEYVAFGAYQERYLFCSIKCLAAFRKQYPTRVHRNCYETDCNNCNQCIKRYDTRGFKRVVLPIT